MILDASVRLGEMTKEIPTASADRGNQYTGGKGTALSPSQKTKEEAINDLGFSKKQVQRFETLANNRDLVEQEKAQAREGAKNAFHIARLIGGVKGRGQGGPYPPPVPLSQPAGAAGNPSTTAPTKPTEGR